MNRHHFTSCDKCVLSVANKWNVNIYTVNKYKREKCKYWYVLIFDYSHFVVLDIGPYSALNSEQDFCLWYGELWSTLIFLFILISFLQLCCPIGVAPMEKSSCLPWGKPAPTESRYTTYGAYWMFKCFHNPPNSDLDYGIFNVRTDVNACDCVRGCTDTVRESALKVDSGRKIYCCTRESNQGIEPGNPTRESMLYQLSSIPTSLCDWLT